MIFADTSFWVALRNRRDSHHREAISLLHTYGNTTIITSNHVRGETWTFLRRRVGHAAGVGFLDAVERSTRIRVVMVAEDVEMSALRWLRQHDEQEYSFVDATSFALMRALRLREVLAFDEDFKAAGFLQMRL